MFLKSERKNIAQQFNTAKETYEVAANQIIDITTERYELCEKIRDVLFPELETLKGKFNLAEMNEDNIGSIETLMNEIANMSSSIYDFDKIVLDYKVEVKTSVATAGVAVAAGASCTALAPTALMAIATTFGTASTGTAISALSGAAATNAALAWLGGGTLAAGGGGAALGGTVLALSGPIGWGIAGIGAAGSAFYYRSKNKKAIKEMLNTIEEVDTRTKKLQLLYVKVSEEVNVHKVRLSATLNNVRYLTNKLVRLGVGGLSDEFFQNLNLLNESIRHLANFMNSKVTIE